MYSSEPNQEYRENTEISQKAKDRLLEELLELNPEVGEEIAYSLRNRIREHNHEMRNLEIRERAMLQKIEQLKVARLKLDEEGYRLSRSTGVSSNEQIIRNFALRKQLREFICPALQAVSDDSFEIAKVLTPILAGLIVTGTITIPLTPVMFAAIAIFISRMGIASFCAEESNKSTRTD